MEKLIQNGGGDYNMICHCDYCHYTFDPADYHMAEQLPERCPDCGKLTAHGHPAVRIATEAEIMDYRQIQMSRPTLIPQDICSPNPLPGRMEGHFPLMP